MTRWSLTGPGEQGEVNAKRLVAAVNAERMGAAGALKPGEGPSKEERENGLYDLLFVAIAPDDARSASPYAATAILVMDLDLEDDFGMRDLPVARHAGNTRRHMDSGAAMGNKLIKRLVDQAGPDV